MIAVAALFLLYDSMAPNSELLLTDSELLLTSYSINAIRLSNARQDIDQTRCAYAPWTRLVYYQKTCELDLELNCTPGKNTVLTNRQQLYNIKAPNEENDRSKSKYNI